MSCCLCQSSTDRIFYSRGTMTAKLITPIQSIPVTQELRICGHPLTEGADADVHNELAVVPARPTNMAG